MLQSALLWSGGIAAIYTTLVTQYCATILCRASTVSCESCSVLLCMRGGRASNCASHTLDHSGSKWPKPAKNKISWCDFTSFYKQVSAYSHDFRFHSLYALRLKKLLDCCRPVIFTNFWDRIFWRVFDIWPNCTGTHFLLLPDTTRHIPAGS